MPRRAAVEQWWAVVDADGELVSVGTVLADPLPDGLAKVKVDGPGEGRPWDAQARTWGPPPEPPADPGPTPAEQVLGALGVIAADTTRSQDERVAAILDVLASTASPDTPTEETA